MVSTQLCRDGLRGQGVVHQQGDDCHEEGDGGRECEVTGFARRAIPWASAADGGSIAARTFFDHKIALARKAIAAIGISAGNDV